MILYVCFSTGHDIQIYLDVLLMLKTDQNSILCLTMRLCQGCQGNEKVNGVNGSVKSSQSALRDVVTGGFLRKAIFIAYGNQWVVASALLESCEQSVKIMNACWSPRMYALSKTSCSLELGWHQWLQLSLVLVMSARWVLSCFVCFA